MKLRISATTRACHLNNINHKLSYKSISILHTVCLLLILFNFFACHLIFNAVIILWYIFARARAFFACVVHPTHTDLNAYTVTAVVSLCSYSCYLFHFFMCRSLLKRVHNHNCDFNFVLCSYLVVLLLTGFYFSYSFVCMYSGSLTN